MTWWRGDRRYGIGEIGKSGFKVSFYFSHPFTKNAGKERQKGNEYRLLRWSRVDIGFISPPSSSSSPHVCSPKTPTGRFGLQFLSSP
jgi:hypothetical protein